MSENKNNLKPGTGDINDILKKLAHRYPFIMIDRITAMDEKTVQGIKNVSINEPFFQGHFPNHPVMPGVLQIESLAQLAGYHYLSKQSVKKNIYFVNIDKFKFKKLIIPGDQMNLKVSVLRESRLFNKYEGRIFVEEQLVCHGEFMAALKED